MGDPSYTSKWRCKECGQLYGHNPSECDICGHTVFRALPADGVKDTYQKGEETTELGADISELVDDVSDSNNEQDTKPESTAANDVDPAEDGDNSDTSGLFSRLKGLFEL
jgi:predicted  nucleic acid-binding Zn-ribbon protein